MTTAFTHAAASSSAASSSLPSGSQQPITYRWEQDTEMSQQDIQNYYKQMEDERPSVNTLRSLETMIPPLGASLDEEIPSLTTKDDEEIARAKAEEEDEDKKDPNLFPQFGDVQ